MKFNFLKSSSFFIIFFCTQCISQTDTNIANDKPFNNCIQYYLENTSPTRLKTVNSFSYLTKIKSENYLRFIFDISASFEDTESENDYFHESENDTITDWNEIKENEKSYYFGFSLQYLFTIMKNKYCKLYISSGPYASIYNLKYENPYYSCDEEFLESTHTRKNTIKSLGLITNIGIETYITNRIGLFGEYHFSCMYNWEKREYKNETDYTETHFINTVNNYSNEGWFVNFSTFKFGAFIYF